MKMILVVMAIAFIGFLNSIDLNAADDCYIHRWVPSGQGTQTWHDSYKCCIEIGDNCIKVPCSTGSILGGITPVSGGWIITAHLSNVVLSVKDSNNTWNNYYRDGKNYPFQTGEFLVIDDCPTYEFLENLAIGLNGIWTDANGNYSVFVPSGGN